MSSLPAPLTHTQPFFSLNDFSIIENNCSSLNQKILKGWGVVMLLRNKYSKVRILPIFFIDKITLITIHTHTKSTENRNRWKLEHEWSVLSLPPTIKIKSLTQWLITRCWRVHMGAIKTSPNQGFNVNSKLIYFHKIITPALSGHVTVKKRVLHQPHLCFVRLNQRTPCDP